MTRTGRPRSRQRNAFAQWLDAQGWTNKQAAVAIGISESTVAHYRSGRYGAGKVQAAKISALSEGKVTEFHWNAVRDRAKKRRADG